MVDEGAADDAALEGTGWRELAARVGVSLALVGGLALALVWLVVGRSGGLEDAQGTLLWVWGFTIVLLVIFFGHAVVESWRTS